MNISAMPSRNQQKKAADKPNQSLRGLTLSLRSVDSEAINTHVKVPVERGHMVGPVWGPQHRAIPRKYQRVHKNQKANNVAVPTSIGLLGYDDFELADSLEPPITVVREPVVGIATRAAELLFQLLEKGKHPKGITTLKVDLVYRGSCGEMLATRRSTAR